MNLNMKRFFNIQLKRLERNNNKFITDYIKILEKKNNKKIKEVNTNLLNYISNIFCSITIGTLITSVYIQNKI